MRKVTINGIRCRRGAFQSDYGRLWCRIILELVRRISAVPGELEVARDLAPRGDLLLLDGHFIIDLIFQGRVMRYGQQEDAG